MQQTLTIGILLDIGQPVRKNTQAAPVDSKSSDDDSDSEENDYLNFKCYRRQRENSMNKNTILIKERQMAMRGNQTSDSGKKEISNSNTRGSIPFNCGWNNKNMDDTFGDNWEYMELCHSRKQRIKKASEIRKKKIRTKRKKILTVVRKEMVRDKLPKSNKKSETKSDKSIGEEKIDWNKREAKEESLFGKEAIESLLN